MSHSAPTRTRSVRIHDRCTLLGMNMIIRCMTRARLFLTILLALTTLWMITRTPWVEDKFRFKDANCKKSVYSVTGNTSVAIGLGITSTGMVGSSIKDLVRRMSLFTELLPSFCATASVGYKYHFYISYDFDDGFFASKPNLTQWTEFFFNVTKAKCKRLGEIHLHIIRLDYAGRPARAQNDAMMAAYRDGIEFLYRVNDDTYIITRDWTECFITQLQGMTPPLVGVVGPNHVGGKKEILTYDFVHRTHIDIFGYYYPRRFSWWYADDWITHVYKPHRSKKLQQVEVIHTGRFGQRYLFHEEDLALDIALEAVDIIVMETRVKILKYLSRHNWTAIIFPET